MKNPPNIDAMIAALFTAEQRDAIRRQTALGGSKLEVIRQIMNRGLSALPGLSDCQHCHRAFEHGRGTGRRLDAKFCSDQCRISFNSLRRSV